jgi:hypothetical protein
MLLEVIDTLITACPVEGGRLLDSSQLTFRMLAMAYGGGEGSLVTSSILTTLARQCANDPDYFKVKSPFQTPLVEALTRLQDLHARIFRGKCVKCDTNIHKYMHIHMHIHMRTHKHTFARAGTLNLKCANAGPIGPGGVCWCVC